MGWMKWWGIGMFGIVFGLLLAILIYINFGSGIGIYLVIPGALLAILSAFFGKEE